MNGGGIGGGKPVTWIALHWQRSRWRRRRRSGQWWWRHWRPRCRCRDCWGAGRRPTDRPPDRGRLPQRVSEGLVGAGNRCAAVAAFEAVASPESRQTSFLPSVRILSPSSGLASCSPFSLLSGPTDRPPPTGDATGRRQRYEWFKAAMHYGHMCHPPHAQSIFLQCVIRDIWFIIEIYERGV